MGKHNTMFCFHKDIVAGSHSRKDCVRLRDAPISPPHPNPFSAADESIYPAASLKLAAAASGVRSRWGEPSISKPTMNFRIVAERRSGGMKMSGRFHSRGPPPPRAFVLEPTTTGE